MENKDKKYWRSPGQLKDSPEYRQQLLDEYMTEHSEDPNQFSRRSFLRIMGASMALAGLAGCRRPVEKIIPYVKQAEEVIPGVPQYYATTMPFGNSAYGLIVESHEGRPTKIEGNPAHPSSLGASNLFMQAAILNLYDPDRSSKVFHKGKEKKFDEFITFYKELFDKLRNEKGEKLAVLSESFTSPTLSRIKKDFEKAFPNAKWIAYEPISDENRLLALENLTGKKVQPVYHYDKADIIVSFDADFVQSESDSITAAKGFGAGRKITSPDDKMNRLYVIESGYSLTGASADHRLRLQSNNIGQFVLSLAKVLNQRGYNLTELSSNATIDFNKEWLEAIAGDLQGNQGRSLIVAGRNQPQWVHEAVYLINEALGSFGKTITFTEMDDSLSSSLDDLKALKDNLEQGQIETLIIVGGNPVYNAPIDLDFDKLITKTKSTIHLSEHFDETSSKCDWHIPRAHFLESWGDARAVDGTPSIVQPLISPLQNGISDVEFYSLISAGENKRGYEAVRATWGKLIKGDFETGWKKVLHDGLLENSSSKSITPTLNNSRMTEPVAAQVRSDRLEVVFRSAHLYDGRFANNGWLQELPDPVTKLVWDNAAVMNVKTADAYNLQNGDIVELAVSGRKLETPVWIVPGYAENSIGLGLGYGRKKTGRIADNIGFNTYLLRSSGNMYLSGDVEIIKTDKKYKMSNTQDHNRMEGRPIFRETSLAEYRRNPEFAREMVEHPPLKSIYPDYDYSKGYQWGMVIDLNTCIGCGICTLACQSENNIPIVGKEQVGNGREMHWMRNDRYFAGDDNDPSLVVMPVTCQHCVNAPCEQVCPVAATSHDEEGINTMTYNRCIGTRYCSNNCPYKVRKFNFFNYTKDMPEIVKMAQNPDVTVRSRGVMEKCTFCIQRINRVKRTAKKENRTVYDGELQAACQQACPIDAIKFGNINDPESVVAKAKKIDRNYELLAELNIQPRNSYLAKIRNLNAQLNKD
ncbi:MAG: TAT-variant-translocated molybdopterin oxidoreductase [candidate division Zixibacteria bacterium]|nr:TAT-variant-translocated molybdopterin oxidoreductase [candidate division Zixibacteria bacterium]